MVADDGLARRIVKFLTNETKRVMLVDVCAGVGQYGFWFRAHNATIDWRGFDWAENIESFTSGVVKWIDVTDPLFDSIDQHQDWVMSLECGEASISCRRQLTRSLIFWTGTTGRA